MAEADFADDLALLANTAAQAESSYCIALSKQSEVCSPQRERK